MHAILLYCIVPSILQRSKQALVEARVFMANFNSIRERFGGRSVGHTVVVQAGYSLHL